MRDLEKKLYKEGYTYIAGIDEVGRGPLAGPVIASAVILPIDSIIEGIKDSKKLSAKKREILYEQIILEAITYAFGIVEPEIIDIINIRQASLEAMKIAIEKLNPKADYLLIDGRDILKSIHNIPQQAIIKGDNLCYNIAAASILAKVYRDNIMQNYDKEYPQYDFAKNKGYPTKAHRKAILQYGRCLIHRKSFHIKEDDIKLL